MEQSGRSGTPFKKGHAVIKVEMQRCDEALLITRYIKKHTIFWRKQLKAKFVNQHQDAIATNATRVKAFLSHGSTVGCQLVDSTTCVRRERCENDKVHEEPEIEKRVGRTSS